MVIVPAVTALDGVVLSELRGAGVASDRTDVTVVPLVLAGSVRRGCSCQSRHAWLCSTSPRSSYGSGQWRGCVSVMRRGAKAEGRVMADPSLGVRFILLGLTGPQ